MYTVIYRPANALQIETRYYGPFVNYEEAETFLCELPLVADLRFEGNSGVKFIQSLEIPKSWEVK